MTAPIDQIWEPPVKPAELVERRLVEAILKGSFPINSSLPAERELASSLGVTRPTLREALQRLARDGWLEIRQGHPTRVRDYWHEGNLGVLHAIVSHSDALPPGFITNLLVVRLAMAPAYTRLAVEQNSQAVVSLLESCAELADIPEAFAQIDWDIHSGLTVLSCNPIFTLILNGFAHFYVDMARIYFQLPEARQDSRTFYQDLSNAARQENPSSAEVITRRVMAGSIHLWQTAKQQVE